MNDRRAIWAACILPFTIPLAAYFASSAKADPGTDLYAANHGPAVCQTLDRFPSFAGIQGVADAIHFNDGYSYADAGSIVADSVIVFCPSHLPLLQLFIDTYATPRPTGGAIGGAYRA